MSGQTTTISTADGDFSAYVARPSAANAPAVVVIQEIFGVNAVMRGITDELAAAGYLAICPDLFWRIEPGIDITDQSEAEWKRAFELYQSFDVEQGVEDIAATIAKARADPGCSGKVGAVGFCLGGLLAFLTGARTDSSLSPSCSLSAVITDEPSDCGMFAAAAGMLAPIRCANASTACRSIRMSKS